MHEKERHGLRAHDLEHSRIELDAELRGCRSAAERSLIRRQRTAIETDLREWDALSETADELPAFWGLVHGEAPGYLALFSGVRDGGRLQRPQTIYTLWPEEAEHAVGWVVAEALAGRELYHCAHLLTEPRRRKHAAAPVASLYIDLDHETLPPADVQPSVTVASSPGRFQCYFRLTHALPPVEAEHLNRRLGALLAADPSGWDLTQLLRVPGTRNFKYAERPRVRVLEITERVYDPTHLDRLLPELLVSSSEPTSHEPVDRSVVGEGSGVRLSPSQQRIWQGRAPKRTPEGHVDRSASLVKIARALHDAAMAPAMIAARLAERDASLGWRKYSDRTDAAEQYRRIAELVSRSVSAVGEEVEDD